MCTSSRSRHVTGLLVEPRNPGELAAAIGRILNDRELDARLASGGRHIVAERSSLEVMVAGYRQAYATAIERRADDRA